MVDRNPNPLQLTDPAAGFAPVAEGLHSGLPKDDDTRARLLAAAGPVFAAQGFDRSTVREISRAAKVNVAAIGYHFGDKKGLYLEVVRDIRQRRECNFPLPSDEALAPCDRLRERIRILLSRMLLEDDEQSWETQLLMREMQSPTEALNEMVEQSFRPMFEQLCEILSHLMVAPRPAADYQQLAFSVIGQCLYYRVAGSTVRILIPENVRAEHYGLESLAEHITRVTLAATQIPNTQL